MSGDCTSRSKLRSYRSDPIDYLLIPEECPIAGARPAFLCGNEISLARGVASAIGCTKLCANLKTDTAFDSITV